MHARSLARAALLLGPFVIACAETGNGASVATNEPADAGTGRADTGKRTEPDDEPDDPTPDAGAVDAAPDVPKGPFSCTGDGSFPSLIQVPEASSSAEVELLPGVREMLVLSDSGNNGAALLIALGSGGGGTRKIKLSLDAPGGDDVEGSAWRGGKLYTLTSSGAVRRFTPDGTGSLVRDQDAYAIGAEPYACADLTAVNCGKNYEGLCLRAANAPGACAGYAASKAEGKLYCVTIDAQGKLGVDANAAPITLSIPKDSLSDCAFGAEGGNATGALVVATNVYNGNKAYRVDEATGSLTDLPTATQINTESIAVDRDGALYVFDDNSQALSMAARTACQNW